MKAYTTLRTLGWLAGTLFPQQALRVLQGRDFNAALGRVDDALAVAEEQVEAWEPGQSPMEQAQAKINSSIAMAMGRPSDFPDCTCPARQAADLDDHRPACAARAADSPAADERIPDQRPAAGRSAHDDRCESEFIHGPMAYSPCGCADRAANTAASSPEVASYSGHDPRDPYCEFDTWDDNPELMCADVRCPICSP